MNYFIIRLKYNCIKIVIVSFFLNDDVSLCILKQKNVIIIIILFEKIWFPHFEIHLFKLDDKSVINSQFTKIINYFYYTFSDFMMTNNMGLEAFENCTFLVVIYGIFIKSVITIWHNINILKKMNDFSL